MNSPLQDAILASTEATHAGVARQFAAWTRGQVRWPEDGEPMLFSEGRWQASRVLLDRQVADFCEAVHNASQDPKAWMRSSSGIAAVTARLPSEPGIHCAADAFDADPHLMGVGNGIVDLRTGTLVPSTADLMVSRFARGNYRPDDPPSALARRWLDALDWSLGAEVVAYLQRLVGASCFGHNDPKVFGYIWGVPYAGKSTFTDVVVAALGDYATAGSIAIVSGKAASDSAHTAHMTPMAEYRMVVVPEVTDRETLNAGQIKALTGEGSMNMRDLYSKTRQYPITATLWMMGNTQSPRFDASDAALVERLQTIGFDRTREGEDRDPAALGAMRRDPEVWDAALTWAVQGAALYATDGLGVEPAAVSESRAQYVQQHDTLGVWLALATEEALSHSKGTRRSALLAALNDWERQQGEREAHCTTPRQFAGAMRARGYPERHVGGYPTLALNLKDGYAPPPV